MSAAQHTPGPWSVVSNAYAFAIRDVKKVLVCSMSWHSSSRQHYTLKDESAANARLIAAAPELLTMLKAVYDWQHGHGSGIGCTETAMRELIMKATGEPK